MQKHHWLWLAVGAAAGYFLYTKLQSLPVYSTVSDIVNSGGAQPGGGA